MPLFMVKYWHWYVTVHVRHISLLDIQTKHTHAPNHTLKMSVNRASTERQQSVNRASTERQQSVNRASTERQQSVNRPSTERQQSVNRASTERQQTVNHFGCCILYNPRALLRHIPIINVLTAFMNTSNRDMVTAQIGKWASTESLHFRVLHLVWSKGCATACTHNRSIGSLDRQYGLCQCRFTSSLNGASSFFGPVNKVIG